MSAGGDFDFLGRIDEQIKLRGIRIEPGEVRTALCRHSAVRDAAVVVQPGSEENLRLAAYVVCDGESATAADLRSYLADILPDYMVPSVVILLPALPLTVHGKVDYSALPEPGSLVYLNAQQYAPPRSQREELLAAIWAEILGTERIGVYDSFFELGGHSIVAVQMISRIREMFGVEVPVRLFFDSPTIAGLAHSMDTVSSSEMAAPGSIPPSDRGGDIQLSFGQQEMWLIRQLEPESAAYNLPFVLRLRGVVQPEKLRNALFRVTERHESLRTAFRLAGDVPVQRVMPAVGVPFEIVDLRESANAEAAVMEAARREGRQPV